MNMFSNFIRSLILTIILTFMAPFLLVALVLTGVCCSSYIPGWQALSSEICLAILQFLATFGSGSSWSGVLVIGLTCSAVGALFDTYAFYRYQMLRGQ